MKIMFLYPNHVGYFRCPVGLTLIMTVCANAGHDVKLSVRLDFTRSLNGKEFLVELSDINFATSPQIWS